MKTFNSDDFSYDQLENTDFVFMRWKVSSLIFTPPSFPLCLTGREMKSLGVVMDLQCTSFFPRIDLIKLYVLNAL